MQASDPAAEDDSRADGRPADAGPAVDSQAAVAQEDVARDDAPRRADAGQGVVGPADADRVAVVLAGVDPADAHLADAVREVVAPVRGDVAPVRVGVVRAGVPFLEAGPVDRRLRAGSLVRRVGSLERGGSAENRLRRRRQVAARGASRDGQD